MLLRHLPRHIDVGHARVCEAVVVVGVHTHVAELVAGECTHGLGVVAVARPRGSVVELGPEGEAHAAAVDAHVVVAHLAVGVAQLEHVYPLGVLLDPRLLADVPCHGVGREESEAVALGEVLGAVVAEVEVGVVAVFPSVGEASCQTLVAVVDPVVAGVVLCVFEHGPHLVVSEGAVIVELCLDKLLALRVLPWVRLHGLRVGLLREEQFAVGVAQTLHDPLLWPFRAFVAAVGVNVESEASVEFQTLGHEVEVLLEGCRGLHGVVPCLVVACLRDQDIGVGAVAVAEGSEASVGVLHGSGHGGVSRQRVPDVVAAESWLVLLLE